MFYALVAIAVVVPFLILVSIVAFIYRRWKKKKRLHGAESPEEELPINIIYKDKVSCSRFIYELTAKTFLFSHHISPAGFEMLIIFNP